MGRRFILAGLLVVATTAVSGIREAKADALSDLAALRTMVSDTVAAGDLAPSYGTLLIQVCTSAERRIQQGRPAAALVLMKAFQSYVNKFVTAGALAAEDGAAFNDLAQSAIDQPSP